jgi:hypothetical protein
MSGTILGISGFIVVVGAWAIWFALLNSVKVPRMRWPFVAAMLLGVLPAIAAFFRGAGSIGGTAAFIAILMGGMFIVLRLQSAQAGNAAAVIVGGPILYFTALDDQGEPFNLASLLGKPFLLKFFRGHW